MGDDRGGRPHDAVNHPSHYTSGRFEAIEVIEDALTPEMFEGYCIGNVLKYTLRYRLKNGLEDLRKARWYLDRIIGVMEAGHVPARRRRPFGPWRRKHRK